MSQLPKKTIRKALADINIAGKETPTKKYWQIIHQGKYDACILTCIFALEQIEADFFSRVITASQTAPTWSKTEYLQLKEIAQHEIIHREFFKKVLCQLPKAPKDILPNIEFNWSAIDFQNRLSVLFMAQELKKMGISVYQQAMMYLRDNQVQRLTEKIKGIENKHAFTIKQLITASAGLQLDFRLNQLPSQHLKPTYKTIRLLEKHLATTLG